MDIEDKGFDDYVAIVKRRKWQLIVPAILLFGIAVIVAVVIPPVYGSSATILIEQQEIPTDLIRSTVTSFADQRIQSISQRVMTFEKLGQIIKNYNLYPKLMRRFGLSSAVDQMREDLHLDMISAEVVDPRTGRPAQATIAFSLSYESEFPHLAQKVANEVTTLFLNENIKNRQESVTETSNFLKQETQKLADIISTLEGKLALFKEEHSHSLPGLMTLNLQLLQRTEDQQRDNRQAIRTLEERKIYLESELAQLDPYSKLYSSTGERVLSAADQLKVLETGYAQVAARYSKSHPTRIEMEREIAALRREVGSPGTAQLKRKLADQRAELVALRERYSGEHPDVERLRRSIAAIERQLDKAPQSGIGQDDHVEDADNPAYVQLQTQLATAISELESLRQVGKELKAEHTDLENRIADTPQIEREYLNLTRDYDNAMAKYREVKNKQMEADLAKALETERKGERFSLIEPPRLPEKPDKPNRPAIVVLGFVLAVGGGVGNLAAREVMDKRIYDARIVRAITGAPPLVMVPYLYTDADRRRWRLRVVLLLSGLVLAAVLAPLAVDLFMMPLDVLWFKLLLRFGLGDAGTL